MQMFAIEQPAKTAIMDALIKPRHHPLGKHNQWLIALQTAHSMLSRAADYIYNLLECCAVL